MVNLGSKSSTLVPWDSKIAFYSIEMNSRDQIKDQIIMESFGSDKSREIDAYQVYAASQSGKLNISQSCQACFKYQELSKNNLEISSIFGLASFTLFNAQNQSPILMQLCEWTRSNFTFDLTHDFELVNKFGRPESHPKFWQVLNCCCLRGHFDAVLKLFGIENEVDSGVEEMNLLGNLLNSYPRLENFNTILAFKEAWYKWNQDAIFALDQLDIIQLENENMRSGLKTLFSILAGKEAVILDVAECWQDALLGMLLFEYPTYGQRDLNDLLQIIQQRIDLQSLVDLIYISMLKMDISSTISCCFQFDKWLTAHLVDLLDNAGLLQELNEDMGPKMEYSLKEWYMLEFIEQLLTVPELRFTAFQYYTHCPVGGKSFLQELVPRVHCDNAEKLEQLLKFCDENDLVDAKFILLRIAGKNALVEKDYTRAIEYYLKVQDNVQISAIVDTLLERFIRDASVDYEQVVQNIPSAALFKCPALAFLVRYTEFQQLYKENLYKEAADLVVKLFVSGTVPDNYRKSLLLDTLPLLEGELNVFSSDQIMELMRFAEQCTISDHVQNYVAGKSTIADLDQVEDPLVLLKLALCRSLAAALVMNS